MARVGGVDGNRGGKDDFEGRRKVGEVVLSAVELLWIGRKLTENIRFIILFLSFFK